MSEFIAERLWPDALVERSIFGTDDPEAIWAQVAAAVPDAQDAFAFRVSVGAVVGVLRRDGSRVAVKVHKEAHDERYLQAVQRVMAHLHARGFPCPRPLGVRGNVTLEEWRDDGEFRDAHDPDVRAGMARTLAELHRLTDEIAPVDGLRRAFFPDAVDELYPVPHSALFDFDATRAGAEWIDEIAAAARPGFDACVGRLVTGHADWSVKHFRWGGLRPTVVYDWDSLNMDPEPRFAGTAAGTFTYTEELPVRLWPSAEEARAFLADYEAARGAPFTAEERSCAESSAVYVHAYSARCAHAVGGIGAGETLREYAEAFL